MDLMNEQYMPTTATETKQQDIKKWLSIRMPTSGSGFKDRTHYNQIQYKVMVTPGVTEEEKKKAMENLLKANEPLFLKRAKKEQIYAVGLDFDDVLQIERLNFITAVSDAVKAGKKTLPSGRTFDPYASKKMINETYSPCGIKMSYATKKRKVSRNAYNLKRYAFVEKDTNSMNSGNDSASKEPASTAYSLIKEGSELYITHDKKLFGDVWADELRTGLELVVSELSDMEVAILFGIADGLSNVKIAERLGTSEPTIRRHVPKVLEKARSIATDYGLDAYEADLYR